MVMETLRVEQHSTFYCICMCVYACVPMYEIERETLLGSTLHGLLNVCV